MSALAGSFATVRCLDTVTGLDSRESRLRSNMVTGGDPDPTMVGLSSHDCTVTPLLRFPLSATHKTHNMDEAALEMLRNGAKLGGSMGSTGKT